MIRGKGRRRRNRAGNPRRGKNKGRSSQFLVSEIIN